MKRLAASVRALVESFKRVLFFQLDHRIFDFSLGSGYLAFGGGNYAAYYKVSSTNVMCGGLEPGHQGVRCYARATNKNSAHSGGLFAGYLQDIPSRGSGCLQRDRVSCRAWMVLGLFAQVRSPWSVHCGLLY